MNTQQNFEFYHLDALLRAIDFFGSMAEMARQLNITTGHLGNWKYRDKHFPPQYARLVEEKTLGVVKKEELCPHVFC